MIFFVPYIFVYSLGAWVAVTDDVGARGKERLRYSVYLLYWYKSTNADT
jgi:hypothetical protein